MDNWNYRPFWDETLNKLREEIQFSTFSMLLHIEYESSTENSVVLAVPSKFVEDQVTQKHKKHIETKLLELSGKEITVEFVIKPKTKKNQDKPQFNEEKTIAGVNSSKRNTQNTEKGNHRNLNPDYNFDDFVIGDNNTFAVNAAAVVSKNPGTEYNPLLIYGGVGLGKTHLMQATGNALWKSSNLNIIYVTAENFTNEFIQSLDKRKMAEFKKKYRSSDVLLIDDIHFFQGKKETQEELFHTFNELYERNKQIIFTCDRPASELKDLSQRLKSRFERGLNVDLQTPGFETRQAILRKKREKKGALISDEVLEVVAKNISSNVRDLEAALTKLIAYTNLTHNEMTTEKAKDLLRDVFGSSRQRNVSVDIIQKTVADYFSISISDIKSKKRTKSIAFPRQVAMYLCREMTECSTTELGNDFGGKDHSTILHGSNKIEEQMTADPTLETTIHKLETLIKEAIQK